jgi:hypothetical protein
MLARSSVQVKWPVEGRARLWQHLVMPKDLPIRNPALSPSGLLPEELRRHYAPPRPSPAPPAAAASCRFIASHGGVAPCADAVYLSGFCHFHHDALARGEISPLGRILDVVKDQRRRREINWHGAVLPDWERLPADPVTGDER